jgi:hypothetical protein
MSLINPITPPTPLPPPILTPAQAYTNAKRMATNMYQQLLNAHTQLFNYLWNNPNGVTIEQFMTQYGTDAATLFSLSSQIQTLLGTVNPAYVPLNTPSNVTITVNADGTVTITPVVTGPTGAIGASGASGATGPTGP